MVGNLVFMVEEEVEIVVQVMVQSVPLFLFQILLILKDIKLF